VSGQFSANRAPVASRAAEFCERPDHAGPEADAEARAAIVGLAGAPSTVPLDETLAGLVTSWFSPISLGDDGALLGEYDGAAVRVTAAEIRDVLPSVIGQLGVEVTAPVLAEALALVARRARAAHERDVVAREHRREREQQRERAELVQDAAVAQRQAELLAELAGLKNATPKMSPTTTPVPASRPVPEPPPRRWRRG
jgi:hypothetical protein